MSACPTGCGRSAALGNLMCAPCWHRVPRELQKPVWVAWRQLNKAITQGMDPRAILTLKREHSEAKDAAIDFPRPKRSAKPCPFCGRPLRNDQAKQCFACGADWHQPRSGRLAP